MQCGLWMHLSNMHKENLTSTVGMYMYAEVMEKMMITDDNDDDDNDDND